MIKQFYTNPTFGIGAVIGTCSIWISDKKEAALQITSELKLVSYLSEIPTSEFQLASTLISVCVSN